LCASCVTPSSYTALTFDCLRSLQHEWPVAVCTCCVTGSLVRLLQRARGSSTKRRWQLESKNQYKRAMVCCLVYTRVFLRDVREFPFDAVTALCSTATQPQHHTLLHQFSSIDTTFGCHGRSIGVETFDKRVQNFTVLDFLCVHDYCSWFVRQAHTTWCTVSECLVCICRLCCCDCGSSSAPDPARRICLATQATTIRMGWGAMGAE
jgi:hypothetical protein